MNHGSHTGHGMGHGDAASYLRRFWIVTFLLVPLLFTNEAVVGLIGIGVLPFSKWIGLAIATIIFAFALVFFEHAWHEIRSRRYGMMTLVSLAVGAGYLFSVASTFSAALEAEFYLEISTLIWVLLFGHYLEARSSSAAGDALQEVEKLLPQVAHRLSGKKEEDVPVSELQEGDRVRVKPGERIPADGQIEEGSANIDESLVSGESKPLEKGKGNDVVAGSICLDGSLTIVLSRVGEHSTVGQIQQLIAQAQQTKPRSQRIADKAAGILTFVAGGTALLTILVWSLVLNEPLVFSITLAITVLVIACPHALGLAIPTVTTITTSLAVKNGVFLKDLSKIEALRRTDYVVFDKTGTLTEGRFAVREVRPAGAHSREEILSVAAAVEQHSSHIIGRAIVAYAKEQGVVTEEATDAKNIAGKGIVAKVEGTMYSVGNRALLHERKLADEQTERVAHTMSDRGETVVYIADERGTIGLITLADAVKAESKQAVDALHDMGVRVAMLTGDNEQVARNVSQELGIDTYFADVLPEDKYAHIQKLQQDGSIVVMVGDGVNDAPALTQADIGVAIGAGTDVAVNAGDVVLTRNNPLDIVRLLKLSRLVYSKMVQNLVWALGYNVVAIPAAAGAFAVWGIFLRPEIGALLMSLSTVIVVINALTLKRADLAVQ